MNYNCSSVMPNSITGMLPAPAVGYRFHPTNEELIINYLKPKMLGDDVEDLLIIAEVNVCKHEPWDLPGKSNIKSDDSVWYFFCPRDFKYLKSRRSNRRTKEGFWKPTGKNVKINARRTKKQIGTKKTLVFYKKATPKDVRTDWIIHEYEYAFDSNRSNQGEYVLCKLKKKSDEKLNRGEQNHHTPSVSDFEAEPSCNMTSDFEYQNRSEMTVNSACNESEASHHVASDIEYQNSNELMANTSSHLMTSDFGNQYSNELMSDSACDGSGSHQSMAYDFENQYSIGLKVNSPCENWITAFDFEDQVSSPQLNSEFGPFMEMPPKFICQSTRGKGETSCLVADDFENQNHDKESNISASGEGACNPPMTAPLDLENRNPLEKTDMFTLEDLFVSCSTGSFSENIAADSALTEVSLQQLEELKAFFELEDSLNSASQPYDMGSGASVSS